MKCPLCNSEMIWGNDFDWEDIGKEGEGIVSFYSCLNKKCKVEGTELYTAL